MLRYQLTRRVSGQWLRRLRPDSFDDSSSGASRTLSTSRQTWALKRFLTALDAYKSKAPSPIESYDCQSFENDQREKPPSVLCKYEKTSSFIEFDRLNFSKS